MKLQKKHTMSSKQELHYCCKGKKKNHHYFAVHPLPPSKYLLFF